MIEDSIYSIGTAARRCGLSTHTLRKWEKRYGAISPGRTAGGDRRYSDEDIDRLRKLKLLVDRGQTIASVAELPTAELGQRIAALPTPASPPGPVRIAIVGQALYTTLCDAVSSMPGLEIVADFETDAALSPVDADVIVLERPALEADVQDDLGRIRKATGVDSLAVIYKFASTRLAEAIADVCTALVPRPIVFAELERTLRGLVGLAPVQRLSLICPPHRFSREILSELAQMAPALACECPRHTAQLIIDLSDFEAYSAGCEQTQPHDAHIHNMLRRTAASARALFEEALQELAEAEGIALDASPSQITSSTDRARPA